MQQDFFDYTLDKKIYRLEKWILRLQRELWFLKSVYEMRSKQTIPTPKIEQAQQMDFYDPPRTANS